MSPARSYLFLLRIPNIISHLWQFSFSTSYFRWLCIYLNPGVSRNPFTAVALCLGPCRIVVSISLWTGTILTSTLGSSPGGFPGSHTTFPPLLCCRNVNSCLLSCALLEIHEAMFSNVPVSTPSSYSPDLLLGHSSYFLQQGLSCWPQVTAPSLFIIPWDRHHHARVVLRWDKMDQSELGAYLWRAYSAPECHGHTI